VAKHRFSIKKKRDTPSPPLYVANRYRKIAEDYRAFVFAVEKPARPCIAEPVVKPPEINGVKKASDLGPFFMFFAMALIFFRQQGRRPAKDACFVMYVFSVARLP
jgi:hypothetical protein